MTRKSLESSGDPRDSCLYLRQWQRFPSGKVKSAIEISFSLSLIEQFNGCCIVYGLDQRLPWYVNVSVRFHVPLECRVRWQALLLCLVFRVRLEPTSIVPTRLIGTVKSNKIAAYVRLYIFAQYTIDRYLNMDTILHRVFSDIILNEPVIRITQLCCVL